ncbi:DNA-binding response regulator [Pseudonocardiaceae bacterium YIM PH 21723]|nr:DNA-binding response regulator [Pseudonocardiaceae bacterium YIM PH 21723]
MRVLVAEDDPRVRDAVVLALRTEGHTVEVCGDGATALRLVRDLRPDAIVLDVQMPFLDGLTVCRRLRADGDRTPILILTARDALADRVEGLDAGADDYLVKPFELDELLARTRALLRRAFPGEPAVLRFADLVMRPGEGRVWRGEEAIELTRTEFALLEVLLRNAEHTVSTDTLTDRVWGYDFEPTSNALAVYIRYLRRKLEADERPRLIHTARGIGYRLGRS